MIDAVLKSAIFHAQEAERALTLVADDLSAARARWPESRPFYKDEQLTLDRLVYQARNSAVEAGRLAQRIRMNSNGLEENHHG
jgi:hypothetical protein